MPTFFKFQSFFFSHQTKNLYQLIKSQKDIRMSGQQEDNQTRDNLQQQAGMQEDAKQDNQTHNNLQQQTGMQRFAKQTYGKKVLLHRFFASQHINKLVYL